MKNGKCPRCVSKEIWRVPRRFPEPRGVLGVTLWSRVSVDDFICSACGLIETYLSDLGDLDKLKKKGEKVRAQSAE